ncbi:hypothetical protein [Nocardioides sp. GY 10127]|uniref:hypothetical protein n=1 Tax=Nocardioides sp. GY 10127 TaxID=2569762 RepID=UPI0010A92939|nr:hypothetical protein [Nocardioides sp. GY 10127]TIC78815.1 hypothetical protein E8D37_19150 [Nocardioides sp. GY 10127]
MSDSQITVLTAPAVFAPPPLQTPEHAAVYLIFSLLADAADELQGREDDPDYWLSPEEVIERRTALEELAEKVCGAAAVTVQ